MLYLLHGSWLLLSVTLHQHPLGAVDQINGWLATATASVVVPMKFASRLAWIFWLFPKFRQCYVATASSNVTFTALLWKNSDTVWTVHSDHQPFPHGNRARMESRSHLTCRLVTKSPKRRVPSKSRLMYRASKWRTFVFCWTNPPKFWPFLEVANQPPPPLAMASKSAVPKRPSPHGRFPRNLYCAIPPSIPIEFPPR